MGEQLKLFKEELPVWVNGVPFVDEVEIFNKTFGNQITTNQLSHLNQNGCLYMILYLKN